MKLEMLVPALGLITAVGIFSAGAADTASANQKTSNGVSFATYSERVDRVGVVVGSMIAAVNENDKYMPLQVAVGVWGRGPELEISVPRFLLIDAQGNTINPATETDVGKDGGLLQQIKEFRKQNPLTLDKDFRFSRRVASDFYPLEGGKFYVVSYLDRETYLSDAVVFPRPQSLEGVLTLQLLSPGMDKPVEVHFEVPLKHKKTKKHKKQQQADSAD